MVKHEFLKIIEGLTINNVIDFSIRYCDDNSKEQLLKLTSIYEDESEE